MLSAPLLAQWSLASDAASAWIGFACFVAVLLTLDLFVFHRESREPTLRESAWWTVFWCALALSFNALVWWCRGTTDGVNFLTGYLVEWALSMDNVFVFAVIFRFFRVPMAYQYRVLFWGILGAIFMRLGFIMAGTELIERFDWILPVFGVFLAYTAVKLAMHDESEVHPENNILLRIAQRFFRVTKADHREHGQRFFALEHGRRCITPLFLVLLVVESTDVLFAVDSVPAIIGITRDPFLVFTSNIFAILGLRALYFLLAGVIDMFRYLSYGLSAVLGFIGLKMIVEYFWKSAEGHLIPPQVSLGVVLTLLATAIIASIIAQRRDAKRVRCGNHDS